MQPDPRRRAHSDANWRAILSKAPVYRFFGRMIARQDSRPRFVEKHVRPKPGDRILDIGCGEGWVLAHLPIGVDYTGFDLNPDYIRAAKATYGNRGRFYCADIASDFERHAEKSYDIILALGILHHLTDPEAEGLCRKASALLRSGGVLVTLDGVLREDQPAIARWLLKLDRGRRVRDEAGYEHIARKDFGRVETTIETDWLRLPYTHCVMRCSNP